MAVLSYCCFGVWSFTSTLVVVFGENLSGLGIMAAESSVFFHFATGKLREDLPGKA